MLFHILRTVILTNHFRHFVSRYYHDELASVDTSDADLNWSQPITEIDRQLYQKYKLTETEIQYIESTIKSMDTQSVSPKLTKEDLMAAYVNQLPK